MLLWGARAGVPVDPDADEARQWLLRELAKPEYEAAKPTWFDRLSAAIGEWFANLEIAGLEGPPVVGLVVVLAVLAVCVLLGFLLFGLPRLRRRSTVSGELFGANDLRSADELRAAATALAARGEFAEATAEMFRAIARGLAERVIVETAPGTTARGFAARAAAEFPASTDRLRDAADIFDGVRYLGKPGSDNEFRTVADLDDTLRTATPRPLTDTVHA
jgi:hypothetical protein